MRFIGFILLVLLSAQVSTAADSAGGKLYRGPSRPLGAGHAFSWVLYGGDARPRAIGITLTKDALEAQPNMPDLVELAIPRPFAPFNHIAIDWNPMGHQPEHVYDVPHFDFHFYWITRAARQKIRCARSDYTPCISPPSAEFIPQDYVQDPFGVPQMGSHWADPTSPEFNGQPFTATFIYGSYNSQFTFLEPMATLEFLRSKPAFTAPIKQANEVARTGYYPTKYSIYYDEKAESTIVALTGFTYRKAR